jgi:hypothetical protein
MLYHASAPLVWRNPWSGIKSAGTMRSASAMIIKKTIRRKIRTDLFFLFVIIFIIGCPVYCCLILSEGLLRILLLLTMLFIRMAKFRLVARPRTFFSEQRINLQRVYVFRIRHYWTNSPFPCAISRRLSQVVSYDPGAYPGKEMRHLTLLSSVQLAQFRSSGRQILPRRSDGDVSP